MPALRASPRLIIIMSISVIIPPGLQVFTGNLDEVETTGNTIGECLENISAQYPMFGKTIFFDKKNLFNFGPNKVSVFLNGEDAYPDELVKSVKDGDTIQILYSISGG